MLQILIILNRSIEINKQKEKNTASEILTNIANNNSDLIITNNTNKLKEQLKQDTLNFAITNTKNNLESVQSNLNLKQNEIQSNIQQHTNKINSIGITDMIGQMSSGLNPNNINNSTSSFNITPKMYQAIKTYAAEINSTAASIIKEIKTNTNGQSTDLINNVKRTFNTLNVANPENKNLNKNNNLLNTNNTNISTSVELKTSARDDRNNSSIKNNTYSTNITNTVNSVASNLLTSTNNNSNSIIQNTNNTVNTNQINKQTDSARAQKGSTKQDYNAILQNTLNNILKQQRTSKYTLSDYKKQLELSLKLLNKSKSQQQVYEEYKTALTKALKNLNRKQAKKLTDIEMSLFIDKIKDIY